MTRVDGSDTMIFLPAREIIHSLKLMDYVIIQEDNSLSHLSPNAKRKAVARLGQFFILRKDPLLKGLRRPWKNIVVYSATMTLRVLKVHYVLFGPYRFFSRLAERNNWSN